MSILSSAAHAVGSALSSKAGKVAVAVGATILTGGAALPTIAVVATAQGAGEALKPGGNFKKTAEGVERGAVTGAVSVFAGQAVKALASTVTTGAASKTFGKIASASTALLKTSGEKLATQTLKAGEAVLSPPLVVGPAGESVKTRGNRVATPTPAPSPFEQYAPYLAGVVLIVVVFLFARRSAQ